MFGWELPPAISGGLGTACQGLVEGLAASDVAVRFVLPRAAGGERVPGGELVAADDVSLPPEVEILPIPSLLAPYEEVASYTVRRKEDGFSGGYGQSLSEEVARYAAVGRTLGEAKDFDLVHAHDWMTYPAGIAAAETSGVPLVVHLHSCEYDRAGERADPQIVRAEQAGFDAAERVVCVSGYTASVLRERYDIDPDRLSVVHNAVRSAGRVPSRRRRLQKHRQPTVLFLGRLTHQKAPERFLQAAARVADRVPTARFVMAGDGELRADLERSARDMGLARRVSFPGFLAGPAVERAFDAASVFVMPSVSEPFGLVALEAMDRGVPVVLTRSSGVAETVMSALKVDSEDVDALADRVLAVLRHPALAGHLAQQGRSEVRRLTWARQAERLIGVYRELLP